MKQARLLPLVALALSACATARAGVAPLEVRAVDWNPERAPIAPVRAVADLGDDVVVLSDGAATVLRGGHVVAVDRAVPRWIGAGTIPAPGGRGDWLVALDGAGGVRRVLRNGMLEPIADRFDLDGARVSSAGSLGGPAAAFRLDGAIAITDGAFVTRLASGPVASFACGGGRVALGGAPVRVVEVATRRVSAFALPRATGSGAAPAPLVALSPKGMLFVATTDALWGEDAGGDLRVRFEARGHSLHGLAVSADRVWFADGAELGVIEGDRVRETRGAGVRPDAALVGSSSGDVWVLSDGALARFAPADARRPAFEQAVLPVFRRACDVPPP